MTGVVTKQQLIQNIPVKILRDQLFALAHVP